MAINKVVYGNDTLIDLTNDTVEANNLLEGETAHDRSGSPVTGTAKQGHIIKNSSGTAQTQRANMQFLDSYITDDPTNNCTKVENIKECLSTDLANMGDGIIITPDEEDIPIGDIEEDKEEVTADGDTTYNDLLIELRSKIDFNKITTNSTLFINGKCYRYKYKSSNSVQYFYLEAHSNRLTEEEIGIAISSTSVSYYVSDVNGNSYTRTPNLDTKPSSGTIITLYYGSKSSIVELNTDAQHCMLSDGETSVEEEIDEINEKISVSSLVDIMFPIGAIYMTIDNTNPSTFFSGTTWEILSDGYLRNNALAASGGSLTSGSTTLTTDQIPAHTHTATTQNTGAHTHTATTGSYGSHTHTATTSNEPAYNSTAAYSSGGNTHLVAINWGGSYIGEDPQYKSKTYHTHTLTTQNTGAHTHTLTTGSYGSHTHTLTTQSIGGGKGHTHSVEPTYCRIYAWKRTA